MSPPIAVVIAGSKREYDYWLRNSGLDQFIHPGVLQRMFVYATEWNVRGLRDPAFVFVGSYRSRPEWPRIRDACMMHRTFPKQEAVIVESSGPIFITPPPEGLPAEIREHESLLAEEYYG